MENKKKKFANLDENTKDIIVKHLRAYLAYKDELSEIKKAQKEQILECASKLDGVFSKKDIKKLFSYLSKGVTYEELIEDANFINEISLELKLGPKKIDLDV